MVLAPDMSTLVALAECRHYTGDGCVPHKSDMAQAQVQSQAHYQPSGALNKDICAKRSTDGGATWSALMVLVKGAGQPTAVSDKKLGMVTVDYTTANGNWQIGSLDNGATWGRPLNLTAYLSDGRGCSNNVPAEVGPGVGLRLSQYNPFHPNRLLFIGHCGAYVEDIVWVSDDDGASWSVSATRFPHMDEAQLVETQGGGVLANMRNAHYNSTCKCRAVSLSMDGGDSFGPITYDSTLISPVCQASIISGRTGDLYFANPASTTARVNGVVRRSTDNGRSWTSSLPVSGPSGGYGYSCLTLVPNVTRLGLLWETTREGCTGPSCQSVFSTFPSIF